MTGIDTAGKVRAGELLAQLPELTCIKLMWKPQV